MPSSSTNAEAPLAKSARLHGSALAFSGDVEERQSEMLLSWSEEMLRGQKWTLPQHKRAMRCIIELLQNLSKHSGRGSYECGFDPSGALRLRSQNVVSAEQQIHINTAWQQAKEPELVALRERRLDKLVEGERTLHGGAGLGFMDLRACSNDHVQVEFIPCGNQQSHFVLTVSIHP